MLAAMVPAQLQSADTVYAGMDVGDAIIKNASFTDIAGNANADNILRMAVYSVINEYGSTKYRPNDYANKQDVLADLVRVTGKQAQAVAVGEALKKQNPNLSTVEAYIGGHIQTAISSGIITTQEIQNMAVLTNAEKAAVEKEVAAIVKKNWKTTTLERDNLLKSMLQQRSNDKALKTPVTREMAAVWTAKALSLTPVSGSSALEIYGYKDWRTIHTANVPYVEAVHRSGILRGETAASYNPNGKIKRGELAAMLSAAADNSMEALGFTTGYGRVISKDVSIDTSAFANNTTTDIAVQTPEGEILNMRATQGQSIPVIRNSKVSSQSLLQKNDIVEYTLTKDNRVQLLQVGKLKELKGKFLSYIPELGVVEFQDETAKKYQFKLLPTTVTTAQNVPIDISNAEGNVGATAIFEGNTLRAINLDVAPDKINNKDMAVKILFADPLGNILKVEDDYGNRQYLQLSPEANIYINDELQGIEAIGFDEDAVLKVADNKVIEVRVYTDIPVEEEPYTQIITGRVKEVVGNNLFITPDGASDVQNSYVLGNNVPIIKENQNVSKYKLQPGDRVKLYVDSTMGDYVSRVEIQGSGVKIANLYKGDIKDVLTSTGEIILSNVYSYGYFDWDKQGDYIKYKLSDDVELYDGDSLIDLNQLKYNIGKTIYAVSKNNYGNEEIVHGLLKDGYEDSTYKEIDDVKYTSNQLTLSDGRILDYVKGSIVIKDGKLMDTTDIKKDSSAFVIQNKGVTGARTAPIISMDSFTGLGGYTISKGYLHDMGEDYFNLESGQKLTNNSWQSYRSFNYQLSDDTYIYDNIVQGGVITADKFAESRFKPYTYTWPNYTEENYGKEFHVDDKYHSNYEHYSGSSYYHEHSLLYTVTDEYGNAVGINIFTKDKEEFNPDRTNEERITSGQVESIDSDNYMITLNKVMEFSPLYQEWKPSTVSIPLDTVKAVIMKDGKPLELNEINAGDRIYAVSINGSAVLILVE